MRHRVIAILCAVSSLLSAPAQERQTWGMWLNWGDQHNGTYLNPVIPADYSDIDCIRVGNTYYAISSTFQYSPGMTLIRSYDLVNWDICTNIVTDITQIGKELDWSRMNRYGRGIWAGTIRYHNNRFYVFFGTPDEGFFMTSATKPEGPWEPLTKLLDGPGWDDCSALWDEDGKAYVVGTHFADGYKTYLFDMAPDGKSIDRSSARLINSGNRREASKLIHVGDWYYLVFSEFISSKGRYVMAKRSRNAAGPYSEERQLALPSRKDKEPNQGGIIDNGEGKWYFFTHHGSGDWSGRVASLLPVTWIDGWPIIGTIINDSIGTMCWEGQMPIKGKTVLTMQRSDDFDSNTIAPQWQWNYQPRKEMISLTERPGWLRLKAFKPLQTGILSKAGNTLTQRSFRTKGNTVTMKMDISGMADGQRCGLCHFTVKHGAIGIVMEGGKHYIEYRENDKTVRGLQIAGNTIWLKTTWGLDGKASFSYSIDNKHYTDFGNVYQMVWFKYRGDRIGIYCFNDNGEEGFVDIDYLHYDIEQHWD